MLQFSIIAFGLKHFTDNSMSQFGVHPSSSPCFFKIQFFKFKFNLDSSIAHQVVETFRLRRSSSLKCQMIAQRGFKNWKAGSCQHENMQK